MHVAVRISSDPLHVGCHHRFTSELVCSAARPGKHGTRCEGRADVLIIILP